MATGVPEFREVAWRAWSLIEILELAELKGELKKKINQLLKFDILIIDELGYLPTLKIRETEPKRSDDF